MRRRQPTTLPRLLLAALVALSGFGPRTDYAHSHSASNRAHHSHAVHDADTHDDHDHEDEELPSVSDSFPHVHGSWLGLPVTLPTPDGGASSTSQLAADSCPTLTAALKAGSFGPLKERIPWASGLAPPDSGLLINARSPARNPLLDGAGTSYASHGRTVVLRC